MTKLLPIEANGVVGYMFHCPGCGEVHTFYVSPHTAPNGESWLFNGDVENPSFYPSILTRVEQSNKRFKLCHLYVKDGKIQYLRDCTHSLAGSVGRDSGAGLAVQFKAKVQEYIKIVHGWAG